MRIEREDRYGVRCRCLPERQEGAATAIAADHEDANVSRVNRERCRAYQSLLSHALCATRDKGCAPTSDHIRHCEGVGNRIPGELFASILGSCTARSGTWCEDARFASCRAGLRAA